jgi:polyisoprenoid-binding protein YceI
VHGELTIKDRTHPITFAVGAALQDEKTFAVEAHLDFDRTRWNVLYGSGRFFARLGMHLVSDTISLQVFLKAKVA